MRLELDPTTYIFRAQAAHGIGNTPTDGWFSCPLITEVEDGLWQGGCIGGVTLPEDFRHVLSLYPWERYTLGPDTKLLEVKLYDALDQDLEMIDELARYVNDCRAEGKTLVHCQAGLNRSGLIVARALMLEGYSARDAIDKLRESRSPMVLCNPAFEEWLLALGQDEETGPGLDLS